MLLFSVVLFVFLQLQYSPFQTVLEAVNTTFKVKRCAFSWNIVAYVLLAQVRVDVLADVCRKPHLTLAAFGAVRTHKSAGLLLAVSQDFTLILKKK